jgi:hypothetical protein
MEHYLSLVQDEEETVPMEGIAHSFHAWLWLAHEFLFPLI